MEMTRSEADRPRPAGRDDLNRFHGWLGAVERGLRGLAEEAGSAGRVPHGQMAEGAGQ